MTNELSSIALQFPEELNANCLNAVLSGDSFMLHGVNPTIVFDDTYWCDDRR